MAPTMPLSPLDRWIAAKIGTPAGVLSAEALTAYQLARLRDTLQLARTRSPFYRRRLANAPESLASLSDLPSLPFTTAEDLRDSGLQFLCVSQDEIRRVVTLDTSGTTGRPKRLAFTAADQELTVDFFKIGMATFTQPGDRVLILLPGERPGSVGDLLASALHRLDARPLKHGPVRDMDETLALMRRARVDCLVGVPTQVLALATYGAELKLKSALLTTDHVPDAILERIEAAWGCTVYNHYGMTEMGLGGGVECAARRGYHLREADLLFEIIDPDTGAPVPDGAPGEIVFTTLTRRGMPLIRYRTGDISRFLPGPCPCGTALRTLARVTHRADGVVAVGAHTLTMADLDEALFAVPGVLNFSAAVVRAQQDTLLLQVNTIQDQGGASATTMHAAVAALPAIKVACARGLFNVTVIVQPAGYIQAGSPKRAISRPSGK
jgi:phenylacetate-coenzyme A ligase PaaK-like adenylate-forming protein